MDLQSFEPGSAVHDLPVNWRVRYALTLCVVRPAGPSGAARLLSNRAAAMMRRSALIRRPSTTAAPRRSNSVDAAYREVDTALDHLSTALGLQLAA